MSICNLIMNFFILFVLSINASGLKAENRTTKVINKDNKILETVQKSEYDRLKKFEWLPTECAPKIYPIEIYKGILSSEDGSAVGIPSGGRTVKNGWGETGSTYLVGEDLKSVPSQLDITWLSYTENKFYTGSFKLPIDKMIYLFEKGYVNRLEKQETYSKIIVGMAPGGIVSVWMLGSDFSVEIEQYQAQDVQVSMKDFNPDGMQDQDLYVQGTLDDLSEKRKEQLKKEGIRYGIWKTYRKRYSWKPNYDFVAEGRSKKIRIEFYNGEHLRVLTNNPVLDYLEFT